MSARDKILRNLRQRELEVPPLPSLDGPWITYDDRPAQFSKALAAVGGQAFVAASMADALAQVARLPVLASARKVLSLVPGVAQANIDPAGVPDPHTVEDVDVTVVQAAFGVAENAAVWIAIDRVADRAALFLCQHLIVLLTADSLVDNMHQAYARLGKLGPGFGVFLSGPSKTADIEQSLVIGAHGARSASVFIAG